MILLAKIQMVNNESQSDMLYTRSLIAKAHQIANKINHQQFINETKRLKDQIQI